MNGKGSKILAALARPDGEVKDADLTIATRN